MKVAGETRLSQLNTACPLRKGIVAEEPETPSGAGQGV